MASVFHYTSLQSIRKLANLQKLKKLDTLAGAADGNNKVFYTSKAPIVDANYDDVIDATDVQVFVAGVLQPASAIASVDSASGAISLVAAPTTGQSVQCTYWFSPVDDGTLYAVRRQAESWLNRRVRASIDLSQITAQNFPADWGTFVQFRAAGICLVNDYGSSADTEGTSKDGYLKMKTASADLNEYLMDIAGDSDADDIDPMQVSSSSQGRVFRNLNDCTDIGPYPRTDEFFNDPPFDTQPGNITIGT